LYTLDADKLFAMRPGSVDAPDLSKLDEVGFVDFMPAVATKHRLGERPTDRGVRKPVKR
jgi:hypothetical protein